MTDEDKPNKSDILKGVGASTGASLLPYALIGVAGYALYKKYGSDAEDAFSGLAGTAGSINETVENITKTVSNTTKNITNFVEDNTLNEKERTDIEQEAAGFSVGAGAGVKLPKLTSSQEDFITKYSDDTKKTSNFRESPSLNFGLGPETSPIKRSNLGIDKSGLNSIKDTVRSGKLREAYKLSGGLAPINPDFVKNPQKYGAGQSKHTDSKKSADHKGSTKTGLKKPRIVKKEKDTSLSPMAKRGV